MPWVRKHVKTGRFFLFCYAPQNCSVGEGVGFASMHGKHHGRMYIDYSPRQTQLIRRGWCKPLKSGFGFCTWLVDVSCVNE